jgi:hypothetical protein
MGFSDQGPINFESGLRMNGLVAFCVYRLRELVP